MNGDSFRLKNSRKGKTPARSNPGILACLWRWLPLRPKRAALQASHGLRSCHPHKQRSITTAPHPKPPKVVTFYSAALGNFYSALDTFKSLLFVWSAMLKPYHKSNALLFATKTSSTHL